MAALAALACGAVACSSDTDHGPPVGAPNVPIVVTEGGGSGGSPGTVTGQGAANNAGNPGDTGLAGSFNAAGGAGGSPFTDPSAGSGNVGLPGSAGGTSAPPFNVAGSTFTTGGSTF